MKRLRGWILLSTVGTVSILATSFDAGSEEAPEVTKDKTPGRIERLEARLAKDPENVGLLSRLGLAYSYKARDGDLPLVERAVPLLEKGVRLDPEDFLIRQQLGNAYLIQALNLARKKSGVRADDVVSVFERSRHEFECIVARKPQDAEALASHGLSLLALSRTSNRPQMTMKAIGELNRAAELDPESLQPRLARAAKSNVTTLLSGLDSLSGSGQPYQVARLGLGVLGTLISS